MPGKYIRTLWENNKTPLNADNLNKIEEGIETNATDIEAANTDINALKIDVTGLKDYQTATSKKLDSTSDKLAKIDSALENATITAHHSLSIIKETSWVRIAKIRDLEKTGSAIFNLECYGVIASTEEKNIFTASSFSISFGLTRRGEFAVDVLPLSQAPELNISTASSPISSGMLIGEDKDNILHSADYGVWGATAVCLERYGEEVYVCVLFSYPPTDKYSSLELVLSLNNYLNITLLPTLEIVDLSEINTSTLNLLEGTEFRIKDNASEYIFNLSAKATDLKDYFLPEGSVDFSKTLDVKVINSNNEEYKLFNYKAEAYSADKEYPDYLDKGVAQQKGYVSLLTVDNKPYAISHPDFPYDLGYFTKEEPIKASSEAYPTEEYDLVALVASPLKSSDNKTIPFEVAKNFKGTLHLSSAEGSDYSEVTLYYKTPQEVEPEKPTIPEPKVITFEFGYNGEATHKDGSAISEGKVYQEEDYTLQLNSVAAVYAPAYDAKGNSCIKLGTTSKVASFTIEVPEDVNKVSFFVANYKTTAANIKINGEAYSILNNSDDGKYDEIVIDTSETKTLTFETYKPGYRCMINAIKYHIISEEATLIEEPIEEEEPEDTTDTVTSVTYTIDSSNPSVSIPFDTELYETLLTINSGAVNIEFEFYLEDITFIYKIPFLALDDYENGFTLKEFHSNVDFLSVTLTSNIFHGKSKSYSLRSIYNMLESKGATNSNEAIYTAYEANGKAEEALAKATEALAKTEINPLLQYISSMNKVHTAFLAEHIPSGYFTSVDKDIVTHVCLPNLISIGDSVFTKCKNLREVRLGRHLLNFPSFYKCSNLLKVFIPKEVTSMSHYSVFEYCDKAIIYCEGEQNIYPQIDGTYSWNKNRPVYFNITENNYYYDSEYQTDYIHQNEEGILTRAEDSLTHISILERFYLKGSGYIYITKIGANAFSGCINLESFSIPNHITSIEKHAFRDCKSLKEVVIPDTITELPEFCFYRCDSLQTVNLPNTLTSINEYAFKKCYNLSSLTLPEGLLRIDINAFDETSLYNGLIIPESVTYIGNMAFASTRLKTITIPKNVSTLTRTFWSCRNLKTVILKNVSYIDYQTFYKCESLTDIYIGYEGVPNIVSSTFENTPSKIKIHVKPAYVNSYASATNWCDLIDSGKLIIIGDYMEE